MDYWSTLGRVVLLRETSEAAERMCGYLNYSGVDATVSLEADTSLYVVTVPEDDLKAAVQALDRMTLRYVTESDAAKEYSEHIDSYPVFKRSGSRFNFEYRTAFTLSALGCLVIFLLYLIGTVYFTEPDLIPPVLFWLFGGIGMALLISGLFILIKANTSRKQMTSEARFTLHVMEWFISTYTPIHIDYTISVAADNASLKLDELKNLRKELIRSYVTREFTIEDTEYLDFLVDEIYSSEFEKALTVQRAVNAGHHSKLLRLGKKHDKRNGDRG